MRKKRTQWTRSIFLLLAGWAGLAGCGREDPPAVGSGDRHFPAIENMTLVVQGHMDRRGAGRSLEAYFIDRYEVTDGEYNRFLMASGYWPEDPEAFLDHWKETGALRHPEEGSEDYPVRFVDYDDALAYARFHDKDLPTRDQWLIAALGFSGSSRKFPWGDDFNTFFCNSYRSRIYGPSRVGTFENGKSLRWGCYDMIGNVAEWSATPVEGLTERSLSRYLMGGSWTDGGYPDKEEEVFNLSLSPPLAMQGDRRSTLGFRCVRNHALAYIRDTMLPELAALDPEERPVALDETAFINHELYSVLKRFQFEAAVAGTLRTGISPSRIHVQSRDGEVGVLICCDDGDLGLYSLEGGPIWSKKENGEDAPYRFMVDEGKEGGAARIVLHTVWKNLLKVLDSRDGSEVWQARGAGQTQHVLMIHGPDGSGNRLLVNSFTEDRYVDSITAFQYPVDTAVRLEDIYRRIHASAVSLLSAQGLSPESIRKRLALFTRTPDQVKIEQGGLFEVTNLGLAGLYMGEALQKRFQIQLNWGGGFRFLMDRLAPGCRLTLHDLDSGAVLWSLYFPEAFYNYEGVIRKEPVLFHQGEYIGLVLEGEPDLSSGEEVHTTRICVVHGEQGTLVDHLDMNLSSESLTELTPLAPPAIGFCGMIDSRHLVFFELDEGGRLSKRKVGLYQVLKPMEEILPLEEGGEPLQVEAYMARLPDYARSIIRLLGLGILPSLVLENIPEDPAMLYGLWSFPSGQRPWLLTKPDSEGDCLLFKQLGAQGFEKAYRLDGLYYRNTYLEGRGEFQGQDYFLCWGDTEDLICFDGVSGDFRWKKAVGTLGELKPVLCDLDGDGSQEILISSPSGGMSILSLESGEEKLFLSRAGSDFTALVPVNGMIRGGSKILVGVKGEGILVLDPLHPPASPFEKNLMLALDELEKWRWRNASP